MTIRKTLSEAIAPLIARDKNKRIRVQERINAINTLLEIADREPAHRVQIMQALVAYICRNAKSAAINRPAPDAPLSLSEDIAAAWNTLKQLYDRYAAELISSNQLRRDTRHDDLSFAGADFSYLQLDSVRWIERPTLTGANLNHACLVGTQLNHAKLANAELNHANMSAVQLNHANLSHAQLNHANASGTQINAADFTAAQLNGAVLFYSQLNCTTFNNAELNGANLFKAQLIGADLSDAQLNGANLFNAVLFGANLSDTQLNGTNLLGAQLSGATLRALHLRKTEFRQARYAQLAEEENTILNIALDKAEASNEIKALIHKRIKDNTAKYGATCIPTSAQIWCSDSMQKVFSQIPVLAPDADWSDLADLLELTTGENNLSKRAALLVGILRNFVYEYHKVHSMPKRIAQLKQAAIALFTDGKNQVLFVQLPKKTQRDIKRWKKGEKTS